MSEVREPRRIAFCITELDPGGAEKMLVQLVTRLDRARWEPRVYCLASSGPLVAPLQQAGVPVTCLNACSSLQLGVVFRLARLLREFQPALLQSFLFHANLVGRISGRLAGVPRIVSGVRVAEKDSPWRLRLDRWTNGMVDCNVCVSRAVAEFSSQVAQLPREKCVVIPNGIDATAISSVRAADLREFEIPASSRTVLFVGRLTAQKNPFQLLAVAETLLPRHDDLHFLIVGEGPLARALRERVVARGWQSRVHFAGARSDVISLMKAGYCLALTSLWEGMPNVVLEAMACALPVVATQVEGVSELIRDGISGRVVQPGDSEAFSRAVSDLLRDPEKSQAVGLKSQAVVSQQFTIESVVAQYTQLFERLVSGSSRDKHLSLPEKN